MKGREGKGARLVSAGADVVTSAPRPSDIILSSEQRDTFLVVRWKDGHTSKFHYLWLRDNCHCSECRHPTSHQRLFETADIPLSIMPSFVNHDVAHGIEIQWRPNDHRSFFDSKWLRSHCYSEAERNKRKHRPVIWGRDFDVSKAEIDHAEILAGDAGVLRWLEMVSDYGFAIAHGVPPKVHEIERVADLVGTLHETNFGRWFDIVSKPEPGHLAYASMHLRPHTDDAYSYWPPGVDLFYCMAAAPTGGATILVDGFNVAAHLRREHEEHFRLLSSVSCHFEYQDATTDLHANGRIICLDDVGEVSGIRWNERLAGPFDLPEDQMDPFYAAYREFQILLRRENFVVQVPLHAGNLLAFDNHRVLHGRTAFDSTSGHRHIHGCLITRDSFHSRLRSLHRRLRHEEDRTTLAAGSSL
jgi:gamma-butyrobetaine dioxygenase